MALPQIPVKTLLLTLTLSWAQAASAQDNVTFVHGLNGDASSWSEAVSHLESQQIGYSSAPTISAIARSEYPSILDGTIIVAHSMGGLVAREMVRMNPGGKIQAMITVGTPHKGAHGANLPGSGIVATMIMYWTEDLAAPLALLAVPSAWKIASDRVSSIVGRDMQALVDKAFSGDSVKDMLPTGSFLQTLNSSPASTFPAAYYTLWSTEDRNMQYRLLDAWDDGVEDGTFMVAASLVMGVYFAGSLTAAFIASLHCGKDDFASRGLCIYWSSVSAAFLNGAFAIGWQWQYDWNWYIVGTEFVGSLNSDGIVLKSSQAPSLVPDKRWIEIRGGVNHLEQRTHTSTFTALRKDDINVSGFPLEVYIAGPDSLPAGVVGTWTAEASEGAPPYTYDWDYSLVCEDIGPYSGLPCDTWHDGGTSATLSLSISGGPKSLQLRLTVEDREGGKETAKKTVDVTAN